MTDIEKLLEEMNNARERSELELLRSKIRLEIRDAKKEKESLAKQRREILQVQHQISKSAEYYGQSYAALYNTCLEQDKSILTMSIAGLGFVISQIGSCSVLIEKVLFIATSLLFMISALTVLKIFKGNKDYIMCVVSDDEDSEIKENERIKFYDSVAKVSFISALVLAFCIGVLKLF